jgi:transposase-like protein
MAKKRFQCPQCGHAWEIPYGAPRPSFCPQCKSANLHRAEEDRGHARGGGRRKGRGGFAGPPIKKGL